MLKGEIAPVSRPGRKESVDTTDRHRLPPVRSRSGENGPLLLRSVKFTVDHSCSGRHRLNRVGAEYVLLPHAVLVREAAIKYVSEDLHVAVSMCAEPPSGSDAVVVQDAQRAETHVRGIVITREGEGMVCVEPAMIDVTPLFAAPNSDHKLPELPGGRRTRVFRIICKRN
jgi:hypothetical protein